MVVILGMMILLLHRHIFSSVFLVSDTGGPSHLGVWLAGVLRVVLVVFSSGQLRAVVRLLSVVCFGQSLGCVNVLVDLLTHVPLDGLGLVV